MPLSATVMTLEMQVQVSRLWVLPSVSHELWGYSSSSRKARENGRNVEEIHGGLYYSVDNCTL